MKFYMQIQDLVTTGHWKGRVKGGITHNLDTIISVTKSKNGSLVETELVSGLCTCVWWSLLQCS